MADISGSPWIADPRALEEEGVRLFCFPPAGTGAAVYAAWRTLLSPAVALCAVRLPGRESRFAEPAISEIETLVDAAESGLRPFLERPFALLGHCSGSLVAFELARRLTATGGPLPLCLVVSAQGAPDQRHLYSRWNVAELSRAQLLERLREVGIADEEVLASEELIEFLEPMIRADVALADNYRFSPGQPPIPTPIAALAEVASDDSAYAAISAWRSHTSRSFTLRLLPDLHVPRGEAWARVARAVAAEIVEHAVLLDAPASAQPEHLYPQRDAESKPSRS
jgi:medium-chain acyl-[acyl-carrier-protein] hydrolase